MKDFKCVFAVSILCCVLHSAQAQVTQTVTVGIPGTSPDIEINGAGANAINLTQADGTVQISGPYSFTMSNGVQYTFDLAFEEFWVGPGSTDPSLAGSVIDASNGLGVRTAGDPAQLNDLSVVGGQALEGFTVSVDVSSVTGGTITEVTFDNPTFSNADSNYIDIISSGTAVIDAELSVQLEDGGSAGKLVGFNILTTSVPEPNQILLLGILGVALAARRWWWNFATPTSAL